MRKSNKDMVIVKPENGLLYNYFKKNDGKMPKTMHDIAEKEGIERAICDYIAGMTDTFAINLFKDIFLPRSSKIF